FGGLPIDLDFGNRHLARDVERKRGQTLRRRPYLDARDDAEQKIGIDGSFDPAIAHLDVALHRRGVLAERAGRKAGPGVEEEPVLARGYLTGHDLFGVLRIVNHVEVAQRFAVEEGSEDTARPRGPAHKVQRQARLVTGAQAP